MTVMVERTDCRGDIHRYDHIRSINDHDTYYELVIGEHYQVCVPKDNHRILSVVGYINKEAGYDN